MTESAEPAERLVVVEGAKRLMGGCQAGEQVRPPDDGKRVACGAIGRWRGKRSGHGGLSRGGASALPHIQHAMVSQNAVKNKVLEQSRLTDMSKTL